MIYLFLILLKLNVPSDYLEKDYAIIFYKIDNTAKIIVNDSIVFDSGVIDHNPDLEGGVRFDLSEYLTDEKDEVIIQLYNGHPPYNKDETDKEWAIEFEILKNGKEYDVFWDFDDNYQIGLVLSETYYF